MWGEAVTSEEDVWRMVESYYTHSEIPGGDQVTMTPWCSEAVWGQAGPQSLVQLLPASASFLSVSHLSSPESVIFIWPHSPLIVTVFKKKILF